MKVTVDRALLEQELEFLNRVTHWQEGKPDLHDRKVRIRKALANDTLDKIAENERELGIQMQPEADPVPTMICPNCKTDLLKETCKERNRINCHMLSKALANNTSQESVAVWIAGN